jgi:hypothetical protein
VAVMTGDQSIFWKSGTGFPQKIRPNQRRPNFITLNPLRLHVPHLGIMERGTDPAGVHQRFRDGVYRNIADPRDRTKGRSLDQEVEDTDAGFERELVHIPHDMLA